MIQDTHRTEVLAAIPAEKAEEKKGRTWQGVILVLIGALMALGSFVITIRLIDNGVDFTIWVALIALVPFGGGIVLATFGAHRWSSEYVSAAFKDLGATAAGIIRARKGASE